jgi:hypothetical protein
VTLMFDKDHIAIIFWPKKLFHIISKLRKNALECDAYEIRAGLDYGEEVHWSDKNSNPKTSLFEAMVGMTNKWKKTKHRVKKMASSWSSPEAKFLVRGFEVAQDT